jgi:hypothetical protein
MSVPRDLSPHYDPQNGQSDRLPERFFQLFHFGIISFGRLIDAQGDSRRFL